VLGPEVDRDRQRRWVAADLLAALADRRQRLGDLVGRHPVDVELVGVPRGEAPRHVGPVAADHDRDARLLDGLGDVPGVLHEGVVALERRVLMLVTGEHRLDDAQIVAQPCEPLGGVGEAVAVGLPLVALPAGADPQLHPAAADRVHRRDHLGRQRRVPERGADHDVAEPDTLGQGRQRRQRRERLERDLVSRARDRVEVVEEPDRLHAESLRIPGDGDGPLPRLERVPAVVFAGPSLGHDDAELHGPLPSTVAR
jgi:hypothetical protein